MDNVERDALDDVVRNLIERTINTLQAVGMQREDALQLLAIQAIIRMQDADAIAKLQRFIDNDHNNSARLPG